MAVSAIDMKKVKEPFVMLFDIGTIKHLGLQMYSTLPPVIGELVSNAWDADATCVDITIPISAINDQSEIVVTDNGSGMSDGDIRKAYLVIGRDRRKDSNNDITDQHHRKVMGRKGIGKFSAFGIANEIEVESIKDSETSRLRINYDVLESNAPKREISLPSLEPTNTVFKGTKVTLRKLNKFKNRTIDVQNIRRGLARRFSIIGEKHNFEVVVNGARITADERDLKRLLERDANGNLYIWEYDDKEILPNTGWKVSGWIGALNRKTSQAEDNIQRGIVVFARGKLVQEPFVFEATVGQQFALSYIVGELNAEFVDEKEDSISTTRNSLVWDTESNIAFKAWGIKEVNRVARAWADKRSSDKVDVLAQNPVYQKFKEEAQLIDNKRAEKIADKLIKEVIAKDPVSDVNDHEPVMQMCLDFMEFDAFWELAQDLVDTNTHDTERIAQLFREWEVVEAKEMMRVTKGRITTIEKLQNLIDTNALEVPVLHNFLKEFPWVLDPRWTLVADERRYSQLLRDRYPEADLLENDKRIDFLCVREGTHLIVVEIKRPHVKVSVKELEQIEEYVNFMRDHVERTTDPGLQYKEVVGYLLCGDLVDNYKVTGKRRNLELANVYIRRYGDLLQMVKNSHAEFLERYEHLRQAKAGR